jgi:hypothetical protein
MRYDKLPYPGKTLVKEPPLKAIVFVTSTGGPLVDELTEKVVSLGDQKPR